MNDDKTIKELFDMVYKWGAVGVVVDHNAPAFRAQLRKLGIEVKKS